MVLSRDSTDSRALSLAWASQLSHSLDTWHMRLCLSRMSMDMARLGMAKITTVSLYDGLVDFRRWGHVNFQHLKHSTVISGDQRLGGG